MPSAEEGPMSEKERASDEREESLLWIRLPGLFSWSEVCMLFSNETGRDPDWHFSVKLETVGDDHEPLYVVRAALRGAKEVFSGFERERRADLAAPRTRH
jgi:hypothetical protein